MLKQCTKCGELKSLDAFCRDKHTKDGLRCWCRNCTKNPEYQKKYREQNKNKQKIAHSKWYLNNKKHCQYYARQNGKIYYNQNNYRINLCKKFKRSLISSKTNFIKEFPYDIKQLRQHFESQFTPEMTWDNYGTYWEISYIIPSHLFDLKHNYRDYQICWSLMNLRPLEKSINRQRPKDGSDISEELRNKILNQFI